MQAHTHKHVQAMARIVETIKGGTLLLCTSSSGGGGSHALQQGGWVGGWGGGGSQVLGSPTHRGPHTHWVNTGPPLCAINFFLQPKLNK